VELSRLVAQAVETASPLLEERQHRLRLEVPASGMAIDADPIRFTQVLTNLLTNAAKYTNAGGAICMRAVRDGGEVVLQVEDNGIGISPATLPHLFDKFVQERQALDRSRGGLGLGLAIVKSMVLLHGGSVSARSEGEGRGSVFEVRVPACGDVAQRGLPAPAAHADAPEPSGCTVLMVDDNPDVLEAMCAMLEMSGHEVVALADPAAALKLHESFAPAVAILDIGLPGMSGHELAIELRKRPGFAATRFVAMSGYGQAEDHGRSEAAGFCAHLVKPVGGAEVAALIDSLAGR
jgi:CheY-like chemotaxis protein/anti-sigma regulatory factor (Ser/Thr protein kinase)